ncbi:hypothetical protein QQF64_011559 [Cirrhinus molitorella]|uniref:Uncharacterized protein n=1 Tax=Cirrhinus molitorella TaxID=172907 RepID=A0ABR3M0J7_9TELE
MVTLTRRVSYQLIVSFTLPGTLAQTVREKRESDRHAERQTKNALASVIREFLRYNQPQCWKKMDNNEPTNRQLELD